MSFATPDLVASPLVLLADPRMDELEMYSEYLQWRGFRVAVSDNGADALLKAIAVQPDVVCASLVLAERDGAELCAALQADERTCHIPVIVLTTLTGDADLAKARTSGCDALLIKPCLPEVIAAEATRLIEAARRLPGDSRRLRAQ